MKHIFFSKKSLFIICGLFFILNTQAQTKHKCNTDEERVIAAVKKAENCIKRNGMRKAIIDFKSSSQPIFIGDYSGNFFLSPLHPELIGINQYHYKDQSGNLVVQEEIEKAKSGGGWLKGRWRKNLEIGQYQCRKIYICPVSENYFIGSWYYYTPDEQGICSY